MRTASTTALINYCIHRHSSPSVCLAQPTLLLDSLHYSVGTVSRLSGPALIYCVPYQSRLNIEPHFLICSIASDMCNGRYFGINRAFNPHVPRLAIAILTKGKLMMKIESVTARQRAPRSAQWLHGVMHYALSFVTRRQVKQGCAPVKLRK